MEPEPTPNDAEQPARRKCTKAEHQRRVAEVLRLRLGGAEYPDILQYSSAPDQNWQVGDRQIRNYIRSADERCKAYFDAKADHLLSRHLLQRRQLYAHSLAAGDFRTALAVLQDEAKLERLYGPDKVALTDPTGEEAWDANDADINAIIEAALARLGTLPDLPEPNQEVDEPGPPLD
jgi:hypothetical protein